MDHITYAGFKRCLDFYISDPHFRNILNRDPDKALKNIGQDVLNADTICEAIHQYFHRDQKKTDPLSDSYLTAAFRQFEKRLSHLSAVRRPDNWASSRLYRWVENTYLRCRMESHRMRQNQAIFYFPFAMELSKGCSVQCPFCALDAQKHEKDFLYTKKNAAFFKAVIAEAYAYMGNILKYCPLYFATEPFDNPDYEKFMLDFRDLTGALPQTTTAVADQCPDRMRSWIHSIGKKALAEDVALRFSSRTLAQFHQIMAEFSPEEMADIVLVPNNPESLIPISNSGRAKKKGYGSGSREMISYSICCISGFLVNMVDQAVSFIEPELPDRTYPLGYRVRETRHFKTPEDFRQILIDFDAQYIHDAMPMDRPLYINPHTALVRKAQTFVFNGDRCCLETGRNFFTDHILDGIIAGRTFNESIRSFVLTEDDKDRLYQAFNTLYTRGCLREYQKNPKIKS